MKVTNEIVEEKAKALGFDLVGFAGAETLDEEASHLEEWLGNGFQAGMKYMERNVDKRKDVRQIFPDAKSVISLALNYYTPAQHSAPQAEEINSSGMDNTRMESGNSDFQSGEQGPQANGFGLSADKNPPEVKASHSTRKSWIAANKINETEDKLRCNSGKISRYAWGKDYHLIIWDKLKILEKQLSELDPEFKSISYVDTGPVMDKAWAVKAGLGWQGKHTNVINPDLGSWFFIANIITNYEFSYSELITDHCGSCTACIEACPTNAIAREYIVDSNKCISYLTIENKGEISEEFKGKFDGWMFGCDICQDVCPWNIKFSEICDVDEFSPANGETNISLESIQIMDEDSFKKRFAESPVNRAKLKGLKRNAGFLLTEENS